MYAQSERDRASVHNDLQLLKLDMSQKDVADEAASKLSGAQIEIAQLRTSMEQLKLSCEEDKRRSAEEARAKCKELVARFASSGGESSSEEEQRLQDEVEHLKGENTRAADCIAQLQAQVAVLTKPAEDAAQFANHSGGW